MAVNLLNYAKLSNTTFPASGTQYFVSRAQSQALLGNGNIYPTISGSQYICLQATLNYSAYCKDGQLRGAGLNNTRIFIRRLPSSDLEEVKPTISSDTVNIDFNNVLPDLSQLLCEIIILVSASGITTVSGMRFLSCDYPIIYSYDTFSVVASTYENTWIDIKNNSIQGNERSARLTAQYSGNYTLDRSLILTASGKQDPNKYSVDYGIRIPEQVPWSAGYFENTTVSGRTLTFSGVATSGTWTSPVIYMPDPDCITLYLYHDNMAINTNDTSWLSMNDVIKVRAGDSTPLPNFLITSFTSRLYTTPIGDTIPIELPVAQSKMRYVPGVDSIAPDAEFWVRNTNRDDVGCGAVELIGPVPYVYGRSERLYIKGDGTKIAQATPDSWQVSKAKYDLAVPFKQKGDINKWWNAANFLPLLGNGFNACTLPIATTSYFYRLTFSSMTDSSMWDSGKEFVNQMNDLYPHKLFSLLPFLGIDAEPIYFEVVSGITIAKPRHPNEWTIIIAEVFPAMPLEEKYLCCYMLSIRNWSVTNKILLGTFPIGLDLCEEGYAVCEAHDVDPYEGGFWFHVGYTTRVIQKWRGDGILLKSYTVRRGYKDIIDSGVGGLWAISTDAAFYYTENLTTDTLDIKMIIEYDKFENLQMGGVDTAGNLWVVDRDTSSIYRINLEQKAIDYHNHIPYVVGVWPHPTDGSAFVYVGFTPETVSPVIKQVWAGDKYESEEFVCAVDSLPLSDSSGVDFRGRLSGDYLSPGIDDPVWGTDEDFTLSWQDYVVGSPSLPRGAYKQLKISLTKVGNNTTNVSKIRVPVPLIMKNIPYGDAGKVFINPHLRYDTISGKFNTKLLTWWRHDD